MDAFDKLERALTKTTQKKFAKRTGIPQSQVSLLKQRKRPPAIEHIPALNRVLGTTFEEWAKAAAALKQARKNASEAA